ncbi:MAG: histidine phosphatase family protein [Rhizobiaceae bacterium]
MSKPTIYFLRHGQTDWNVELRLQGQQDIPINDTGRAQARQNGQTLARLLDDPTRFRYIASPLGRTRETMNIVRQQLGLPSHGYEVDDRLKEISFGLWETYTHDELRQTEPEKVAEREANKFYYRPPLGESYEQLLERVRSWLPYVTEDAVVVCHGGVLRMLEIQLNGTPYEQVTHINVPQDKIYKWDGERASWL